MLGGFLLLFLQSIRRLVQDHVLRPPLTHNPQILSTFHKAYHHQLEMRVQHCLCRQHQIIPLLYLSTVLGVGVGHTVDAKIDWRGSASEEDSEFHVSYRWSLHIKRQHRCEQRLGAVSFKWRWNKPFPTKPEGFRMLGVFSPLYLGYWNPPLCTDPA